MSRQEIAKSAVSARQPDRGCAGSCAELSIAIPTYGRGQVLLHTIAALVAQEPAAAEVLVVDQTPRHESHVAEQLAAWHDAGAIRWIRLEQPSVPAAMNVALRLARQPVVLFLDDDIRPAARLIAAHAEGYRDDRVWAIAGQVLQPGETPAVAPHGRKRRGIWRDLDFRFWSRQRSTVVNCMAGNLSVRRERALEVGGFDENFVGVAYRFETEFARRLAERGGIIQYEPAARIDHLRAARGGTRAHGNHLRSMAPDHSVGDYYFAIRQARGAERALYIAARFCRAMWARYLLTHPWWIPVRAIAELRGLAWACQLSRQGPKLISATGGERR